jgi:hypothetical protein
MSKKAWDSLSEGDKWRIYSGQRPGAQKKKAAKKKTQLGRHGGGKERPSPKRGGQHQVR